jgi:hypothetical protein
MELLAETLSCSATDLVRNVLAVENSKPDVEPSESNPVVDAIASRGLRVYRVTERSVSYGGRPRDIITVDETEAAAATPTGLDIVLVEVGNERHRVLRKFVPQTLLITNRDGANLTINLNDPTFTPRIVGVVLRPKDWNTRALVAMTDEGGTLQYFAGDGLKPNLLRGRPLPHRGTACRHQCTAGA